MQINVDTPNLRLFAFILGSIIKIAGVENANTRIIRHWPIPYPHCHHPVAQRSVSGLFLITLATIASGTWFYHRFEPSITTWVDAYYFTVITLTTIGYGDMGPTTTFTKLFTTVYVFIGLGIIAGLIGLIGETVIEDASNRQKES